MNTTQARNEKSPCVLGDLESIYGYGYRFCATCGVFHPQPESASADEVSEMPYRNIPPEHAAVRGRAKLALVKREI